MHHSGPLPLTFEVLGVKTAKMGVGENLVFGLQLTVERPLFEVDCSKFWLQLTVGIVSFAVYHVNYLVCS